MLFLFLLSKSLSFARFYIQNVYFLFHGRRVYLFCHLKHSPGRNGRKRGSYSCIPRDGSSQDARATLPQGTLGTAVLWRGNLELYKQQPHTAREGGHLTGRPSHDLGGWLLWAAAPKPPNPSCGGTYTGKKDERCSERCLSS